MSISRRSAILAVMGSALAPCAAAWAAAPATRDEDLGEGYRLVRRAPGDAFITDAAGAVAVPGPIAAYIVLGRLVIGRVLEAGAAADAPPSPDAEVYFFMDTRTRTQSLGLTRSELRVALTLVGINAVPELRPVDAPPPAAR